MLKRIVITGGQGDLGRTIAEFFRQRDWEVSAPGKDVLDVTDRDKIEAYFDGLEVDLVVCCAGLVSDRLFARVTEEDWDRSVLINYRGAALVAQAVIPGMVRRKMGHLLFISSHSAICPPLGQVPYASSKAALQGLTEEMARAYGPSNIRINCISPGFLETKMTSGVSEARRNDVMKDHVLGRFNTPEVVAGFIHHLHEEMPHTSGQLFRLDSRP